MFDKNTLRCMDGRQVNRSVTLAKPTLPVMFYGDHHLSEKSTKT